MFLQEASRKRSAAHVEDPIHVPNAASGVYIKRPRISRPRVQPQALMYNQPQMLVYTNAGMASSSQHLAVDTFAGRRSVLVQTPYPNFNNSGYDPNATSRAYVQRARMGPPQPRQLIYTQPQPLVYTNRGVMAGFQYLPPAMHAGIGREVVPRPCPNVNAQRTYAEVEAFKLKLALELLMGPTPMTPNMTHRSQLSPTSSISSVPLPVTPSPTRPPNQTALSQRGSNFSWGYHGATPLSHVTGPDTTQYWLANVSGANREGMRYQQPFQAPTRQVLVTRPNKDENQQLLGGLPHLKTQQEQDEDKKILDDLQVLFSYYNHPL
ncbi:uncharacterized protein MELLADRAFT_84797 [Melampsora larici-populina 98AG31]|uniref:Uncharacterized protein n=1 Tax=Melampsora larici-populina (strain 98AG31 / pathotype 3-4-7) TaxID=747676 RepID=F4RGR1_MELLP|nr:uncharacterized protein MELLADRAFT_84797 [Melampsora larici-populina 98AG31]EGG08578.1 hypothetical protein MELLADRAFT_84797 [Melampsora larici-populina 98AG31]